MFHYFRHILFTLYKFIDINKKVRKSNTIQDSRFKIQDLRLLLMPEGKSQSYKYAMPLALFLSHTGGRR
jgi:hypothetical protein